MNTVLRAILRGVVWRLLPRSKATLLILGIVAFVVLVLANGAKADNGSCTGAVAANATLTCNLEFALPATRVTVLAEQVCVGAGTMGVQLYPQYAVGVNQTREQFLAAELTQNLPCNGTATIAQRRWVAGGLKRFKLTIQNADATNGRTIQSEWFSENAPVDTVEIKNDDGSAISVDEVDVVAVKGDPDPDAERVHVECGDCDQAPGAVGSLALEEEDRDRLDLSWWGTWSVVGLMLVLLLALSWNSSWRFWRP